MKNDKYKTEYKSVYKVRDLKDIKKLFDDLIEENEKQ